MQLIVGLPDCLSVHEKLDENRNSKEETSIGLVKFDGTTERNIGPYRLIRLFVNGIFRNFKQHQL